MKLIRLIIYYCYFVWLIVAAEEEKKNSENSKQDSKFFISKESLKWDAAKKVINLCTIMKERKNI